MRGKTIAIFVAPTSALEVIRFKGVRPQRITNKRLQIYSLEIAR